MGKQHHYSVTVRWTGNTGTGTSGYRSYERAHAISAEGKPAIGASSDPVFRGDRTRWNPEGLLGARRCPRATSFRICTCARMRGLWWWSTSTTRRAGWQKLLMGRGSLRA